MSTLYLVGTPIGNLEDVSQRALRILRQVRLIAAEDPGRTQRLLARYDIRTPLVRYTDAYDRQKRTRLRVILAALAEGDVALVSAAGMPGLADPGYELLAAVREQGIPIVPVPGPTALGAALSVAGMPGDRFLFLGFLPRKAGARRALLASFVASPLALVAYEAPHRLLDTLADLDRLFGDRPLAVAAELTKLHENVQRGAAADLLARLGDHPPRGEFTLVIAPCTNEAIFPTGHWRILTVPLGGHRFPQINTDFPQDSDAGLSGAIGTRHIDAEGKMWYIPASLGNPGQGHD